MHRCPRHQPLNRVFPKFRTVAARSCGKPRMMPAAATSGRSVVLPCHAVGSEGVAGSISIGRSGAGLAESGTNRPEPPPTTRPCLRWYAARPTTPLVTRRTHGSGRSGEAGERRSAANSSGHKDRRRETVLSYGRMPERRLVALTRRGSSPPCSTGRLWQKPTLEP